MNEKRAGLAPGPTPVTGITPLPYSRSMVSLRKWVAQLMQGS